MNIKKQIVNDNTFVSLNVLLIQILKHFNLNPICNINSQSLLKEIM